MNNRYGDIVGNWGGGYPYGAQAVFGQDVVPALPAGPAALANGNGQWPWFCGGPPAQFDNTIHQPVLGIGAACGPLALKKYLGFECDACVPACSSRTFQAVPQELFKLTRLIIPCSIASSIVVTNLQVGIQPEFAGIGCIPGEAFLPDAEDVCLNGHTAYINQPISLTVRNITEQDIPFSAGLIGWVASGGGPHLFGGNGC